MDKVSFIEGCSYYVGDCIEAMQYMKEKNIKVNLTVTSPPYDDLRTYNNTSELYTFDETHHQVRMDVYHKQKYYTGNTFTTNPQNDYLNEVMSKCKFTFTFFSQVCHIEKIITN